MAEIFEIGGGVGKMVILMGGDCGDERDATVVGSYWLLTQR